MENMKWLFIIILMIPTLSFGQCKLSTNTVDEFTGAVTKITEPTNIGGVSSFIGKIDSSYFIMLSHSGTMIGCVSTEAHVYFKFADGEVLKFNHQGEIDCKSGTIWFMLDVTMNIDKFKLTPLEKIRAVGTQRSNDVTIKKTTYFIDNIPCLN